MSCKDKLTNNCGKKMNAKCVDYEGALLNNTLIEECSDPSVEDVIEDVITQVDAINEGLDLTALGEACIEYNQAGSDLLAKEAFFAMEKKICEIADYIGLPSAACPTCPTCSPVFAEEIACMNLDLGGLVDPCGTQPTTVADLLQIMLNKINK